MAYVNVSCKFSTNPHQRIESVDLTSDVCALRSKICNNLTLISQDVELVYCGRHMNDSKLLSYYDITPGCTVHVLKKVASDPPVVERLDDVQQITKALKRILKSRASRHVLERLLGNEDMIIKLLDATPSLGYDPLALAMFQDKEMLMLTTAMDKDSLQRLLEAHPSLGHAALHLVSSINEEVRQATSSTVAPPSSRRVLYNLDEMSDEEEEEEEEEEGNNFRPAVPPSGSQQTGTSTGERQITSDFFRQAMQMAMSSSDTQSSSTSTMSAQSAPQQQGTSQQPQQHVTEAQLQQLRDMGITDEAVARRALEMTGGDIQLALEFIFGDGFID